MSSKLLIYTICSSLVSLNSVESNNNPLVEARNVIADWKDSSFVLKDRIETLDKDLYFYYVYNSSSQFQGYVTVSDDKIKTMRVFDKEPNINNIVSRYDFSMILENSSEASTSNEIVMPKVSDDLYTSHYDSFSSMQYLLNCPFYYNYPYGPVKNGCVPTAAGMLVSFYDRYSDMSNLIDGILPLNHEKDKESVDKLIYDLSNYMYTSKKGTILINGKYGLTNYFLQNGYYMYQANFNYDFNFYAKIINYYHNPAIVNLKYINLDDSDSNYMHAVLGVGVANLKYSGNFVICHYGDYDENHGDFYVSEDYFYNSMYICEA